ncbi:MAG: hypothetical protein HC926_05395, partial [Synechococcaceae cyanobacterium SM2_3_60]|nr:hypothetical protein [Synechococcaceae cyanobacterium SM2_3_60]
PRQRCRPQLPRYRPHRQFPITPAVSSDRDTLAATTQACVDAIHSLLDQGR